MDWLNMLGGLGSGGGQYGQAMGGLPIPGGGAFGGGGVSQGALNRFGQQATQLGTSLYTGRPQQGGMAGGAVGQLQQNLRPRKKPGDTGYDPRFDDPEADRYANYGGRPWWMGGAPGQSGGGMSIGGNSY